MTENPDPDQKNQKEKQKKILRNYARMYHPDTCTHEKPICQQSWENLQKCKDRLRSPQYKSQFHMTDEELKEALILVGAIAVAALALFFDWLSEQPNNKHRDNNNQACERLPDGNCVDR